MIKNILKGLWKWILWILIILLLGAAILAFRIFVIDKNYGKETQDYVVKKYASDEYASKISSSSTDTVDVNQSSKNGGSFGQKIVNGAKGIANATVSGYKNDSEYDYNSINFDEWFLMWEGESSEEEVQNVLNHLFENSQGNFYDRTSVTAVGFGQNNTVSYNGDLTAYQNGIQEMKNSVTGGNYDISFKYAGVMTYVNEIVITKK